MLMSLSAGYGPVIQNYQQHAEGDLAPRPPALNSIALSEEEVRERLQGQSEQGEVLLMSYIPARLPLEIFLRQHVREITSNNLPVAVVKDPDLKTCHVMSVNQSFREDLAEHSYQFSCQRNVSYRDASKG